MYSGSYIGPYIGSIRGYFFKRTQRGGHAAGDDQVHSSLDAMRMYILRSALWCLGDISLDVSHVEDMYKCEKALRIADNKHKRRVANQNLNGIL